MKLAKIEHNYMLGYLSASANICSLTGAVGINSILEKFMFVLDIKCQFCQN